MKTFYDEYKDDEEFVQPIAQLPWKHNITLMQKVKENKMLNSLKKIKALNKTRFDNFTEDESRDLLLNLLTN